jgi:hypothetical protein
MCDQTMLAIGADDMTSICGEPSRGDGQLRAAFLMAGRPVMWRNGGQELQPVLREYALRWFDAPPGSGVRNWFVKERMAALVGMSPE